jgi:myosin heavy subunit
MKEKPMPTVKAKAKKTAQPAATKPVKKTAQKVTLEDLLTIVADIGKAHKETEKTLKELQESHKKTEKAIRETQEAHKKAMQETQEAIRETQEAHKETEKAIRETQEAHKETEKAIRETQEAHKKAMRETQEAHKETEKAIRETQEAHKKAIQETQEAHKETEKAIRETQRNIGGLNNTMGSLVEHIMTPSLPHKFTQFGFAFNRISTVKWAVEGCLYAEIDGLLENGTQAMAVEVKTTLRRKDIDEHLERMKRIRAYADSHGDRREFMGAMAAMVIDNDTKTYALSQGLFVIEPSGEDVKIVKPATQKVW